MVDDEVVRETFRRVCVGEGRYIGLIFRDPSEKVEFGTARIIGKSDSLVDAMAIAKDIGHVCVAIVEFGKRESSWLNVKRGNRMAIFEAICDKIGEAGFRA